MDTRYRHKTGVTFVESWNLRLVLTRGKIFLLFKKLNELIPGEWKGRWTNVISDLYGVRIGIVIPDRSTRFYWCITNVTGNKGFGTQKVIVHCGINSVVIGFRMIRRLRIR